MARRKSGYSLKTPVPHHQWSGDALALLEDVPIRIFDPAKIIRLPAVFLGLLNGNRDLAKVYRQRYGVDLKDGFPPPIDSLARVAQSEEAFDSYVDWYLGRIEGLFARTAEELALAIGVPGPGSSPNRADADDQARIAAAIESEIFERCAELRDDAAATRRRTLRFLQPYLDHELWLSETSNALPIELLFQLTPTWRWFSLLWMYRAVRDHLFSAEAVLPAWELPGLVFRLCRFDEHRVALIGPVYAAQEAANRATFIRRHADSLKFLFETFHRASSDYFISHAPSIADVSHALSKRNVFDGGVVMDKLDRLTTAMSWVRFADVDEVSRGGMLTLAVVAGFCARHQDIMPMDAELVFSVYAQDDGGCEASVAWGDGAPTFTLRHVDYPVGPGVTGYGAKHLERRFVDVVDQMRTSTRAQNAIRGQLLYNWLEKHFGTLTLDRPVGVSRSEFAERAHVIENSTMEAIAATFRAQACTLYWRDYGAVRPLAVRGAFSVDPRDLLSLERRLTETNRAWQSDAADESFVVRTIRTRAPVYCADVKAALGRGKGSVYCYPLMVNDRVVGVLEITGSTIDQFRWTDRYEFHDINALIVPIFYQRQVFASLDQIYAAFVSQADRLPPDGVVDHRTGDLICKELSEIFLADVSNLWVRDRGNLTKFILTGSTHRRLLEVELPDARNYRGEYQTIFDRAFLDSIPNYVSLEFDEAIEADRVLIEGERYRAGRARLRESPVLEVIVKKWHMREQLFVAVRTEFDSVPRAFLALHQDAAKNVPGMWDSIVELVRRQMLSGFSVLGVTETEQRQTTRFIHHEIRHDINQIIALSTKLRGEVRALRRDFDSLHALVKRDRREEDLEARIGEAQRQLDNVKALRNGDERSVETALNDFLAAALALEPQVNDLVDRAYRTYSNQEKDLEQLAKMQDALDLKREMLQTAQRVRLSDLFGDRAESVDLELVDVFDTVKGILRTYESRLKSKGCFYEFSIRDNPRIEVVREPFLRIVTNLIDNAWKYSLDNSVVEVTWVTDVQRQGVDTQWSLSIASEGPPNGESFQPFAYGVRGANAEEAETEGEGVGLFVVSQAARFLGLQVDYSQYDQGQRHWHEFTIRKGARG